MIGNFTMNIIGALYGLAGLAALILALVVPKKTGLKALAAVGIIAAFAYLPVKGALEHKAKEEAARAYWKETEAIFQEKCRTQAGIKIYRTVPDVEGVVLLKIRPKPTEEQLRDKMWPGAAFTNDYPGNEYIESFLGFENPLGVLGKPTPPITPENRGSISTKKSSPDSRPGYRYVEAFDDLTGAWGRYTLAEKPLPTSQIGWVDIGLEKTSIPDFTLRYGVTYEDHVVPEDRERWIASSTVKVINLQTKEVLGEMTKYKLSYGGISPWLRGPACPILSHSSGADTRRFVDQVLIPRREK